MSEREAENEEYKKNISVRISSDKVDELDRTIKKAQIDGKLPMDYSRADALRRLIDTAIDKPKILFDDEL